MLSYTGSRNLFGSLAGNKDASTLTLADTLINLFAKKISKKFNFLEDTFTITSVASQQFYDLPNDFGRFKNLYTTSGTTNYYPKLITSREEWDTINATTSVTSDVPQYIFIFNGQIGFYPAFASDDLESTLVYHKKFKDSSVADYTTGTIVSIANGAAAVVGSGTTWTVKMAGRYIRITDSDTANTGDGEWYKILSVTDATHLTLDKNYEGISIAAGSAAYTIGQCYPIPEEYQDVPVFQALEVFFTSHKPDTTKAALYKVKAQEGMDGLMEDYGSISLSPVISEETAPPENVNNYIQPSS